MNRSNRKQKKRKEKNSSTTPIKGRHHRPGNKKKAKWYWIKLQIPSTTNDC